MRLGSGFADKTFFAPSTLGHPFAHGHWGSIAQQWGTGEPGRRFAARLQAGTNTFADTALFAPSVLGYPFTHGYPG